MKGIMKSIVKFLCLFISILLSLTSCSSYKVPTFDKLIFRYRDSSVPPRYHRSYTITASAKQCRVVVDVYGKNIVDKTYEIKKGMFDKLKVLAQKLQRPGSYDQQQNGGSTRFITGLSHHFIFSCILHVVYKSAGYKFCI